MPPASPRAVPRPAQRQDRSIILAAAARACAAFGMHGRCRRLLLASAPAARTPFACGCRAAASSAPPSSSSASSPRLRTALRAVRSVLAARFPRFPNPARVRGRSCQRTQPRLGSGCTAGARPGACQRSQRIRRVRRPCPSSSSGSGRLDIRAASSRGRRRAVYAAAVVDLARRTAAAVLPPRALDAPRLRLQRGAPGAARRAAAAPVQPSTLDAGKRRGRAWGLRRWRRRGQRRRRRWRRWRRRRRRRWRGRRVRVAVPLDLALVLCLPRHLFEPLSKGLALALRLPDGDAAIAHGLRVAIEEGKGGQRPLGSEQLRRQPARHAGGGGAAEHALQ